MGAQSKMVAISMWTGDWCDLASVLAGFNG